MNVVVDYPEDFPLIGVDRKVFDRQLRNLFAQPDPYAAHTLDKLRERIGLKSRYHSSDYDELETLFTLVRTDSDQAVRDQLLVRAGEFLLVHLRLAAFPVSSDESDAPSSRISPSWIAAGLAASALAAAAALFWIAPAIASYADSIVGSSTEPRNSAPLVATVTPTGSGPSVDVAPPKNVPTSTDSPLSDDTTTELTFTTWTRNPLRSVDGLKRLMPENDGSEYQIDVTVSRTLPPPRAAKDGGSQ